MSDSQAPDKAVDKARRLNLMISKGFGYLQAKHALEAHGWNVDDAAASILADKSKDRTADSVAKKRKEVCKQATTSSSGVDSKTDGPQLSPDSESKQPFISPSPDQCDMDSEAIEWTVDDAAANIFAKEAKDQAVDSVAKGRKDVWKPPKTLSSEAALNADGPQLSPDSESIRH